MSELQAFLNCYEPQAEEITVWGGGRFPLRVISYFCTELPPLEFVMSVRGIVINKGQVLLVRNADETHIVPGGRRKEGEQLTETLQREILEETGWLTGEYQMLGLWHFRHLAEKPPNAARWRPEFLQIIYLAKALKHLPEAKRPDDYELEHRFVAVEEALKLEFVQPSQLKFLELAVSNSCRTTNVYGSSDC
jgi:ADP-ribose pyrophosphatase YjhB (NUDIX family)